jgi:iron complex transport system substrate-binding protein
MDFFPQRIVCLTEETTELLYLLGQQHRIVGISGFTVRPPQARKEKPKVSAFTSAKIDKILALKPDLVLGFSDLQADIAAELIKQGVNVYIFNQRSVNEILAMCVQLGAMVGQQQTALAWVNERQAYIEQLKQQHSQRKVKPVVYFEEWYDPIITSIQWVAELVEIAGGQYAFPEHARQSLAKNRIVADHQQVIAKQPDIILGSWCGRKFRPEQVAAREGWQHLPAVQNQQIFEIKSADILQPGPAALTDGLAQLVEIVERWYKKA